ncbi:hypothetical protein Ccrd_014650 [Cynara cardunculus var. scolymus]|uniref:Uncharacterized protein n=1 Tax=Cynara cardunculus var. scolymus TaxID=59895 RepID=A0A103YDA3_CYNCS|nr:hypothetical protein Ccrd_014650 [Cynara cardunculus var. scolymus]
MIFKKHLCGSDFQLRTGYLWVWFEGHKSSSGVSIRTGLRVSAEAMYTILVEMHGRKEALMLLPEHQQFIVGAGALPHLDDQNVRTVNSAIRKAADAITNLAHENSIIKTCNLRQTLDDLTRNGFSVVSPLISDATSIVCESYLYCSF